ncbi:MAG: hypothetical protein HN742_20915 [Lentisphaerae bacterium]|jgi:hypothetical protein|nr:hypothetical protein [Lentisphaerota bacterium]MBT4823215.1 hypothetical protein [Lentisphaerota bacterium]MBT5610725.1 hypothetical protein [Lentisphaerota bacterium]MBT7054294.1 hypothetical protein [Lentisphaerota bacterium]MBT7844355.1 hypothetical protein [Lentisphaerota bacterium]
MIHSLEQLPSVVLVLALSAAMASAQESAVPKELLEVKARYEHEVERVVGPVRRQYLTKLKTLHKRLTRKDDLQGALAVKAEMDRVSIPRAVDPLRLVGKWRVEYDNNSSRSYGIRSNGTAIWLDTGLEGKLLVEGPDLLLDVGDGKLEKLTLKGKRLHVEHFNPKSLYPDGTPLKGLGKRIK